jgi:hypothetical protein
VIKSSLNKVRWLSLREIAEMWSKTSGIPESAMLRELRYGVINIKRLRVGESLLDLPPPDDELPDPDTRVDRQWLMEFCTKQEDWPKPEFWFGKLDERGDRYPGRPSVKSAVLQELGDRALNHRIEDTLAEQARARVHKLHTSRKAPKLIKQLRLNDHIDQIG